MPQYAELAHISASTKQLLHTATTMSSSKKDSIRMRICTLKTIEYLVVLFNLIFIERLLKEFYFYNREKVMYRNILRFLPMYCWSFAFKMNRNKAGKVMKKN